MHINISNKPSPHNLKNKILRVVWNCVYFVFFRLSLKPMHFWRRFLLKIFGARIASTAKIHNSVHVWAPWNLTMAEEATLGPHVDCYCVEKVKIGAHSTVSQYCYLCTATHDFEHPRFPLKVAPIIIEDQVWLAADVFVGPGVIIKQGAVVAARSSVFHDIPQWQIAVGYPAKPARKREIR